MSTSERRVLGTGVFESDRSRLEALIENTRGIIAFGQTSADLLENPGDVGALPENLRR